MQGGGQTRVAAARLTGRLPVRGDPAVAHEACGCRLCTLAAGSQLLRLETTVFRGSKTVTSAGQAVTSTEQAERRPSRWSCRQRGRSRSSSRRLRRPSRWSLVTAEQAVRCRQAACVSPQVIVVQLMLFSSEGPYSREEASAASCNANMACELNRSSALKSWAISLTRRAKGALRKRRSVDFRYFLRKHYY